MNQVTDNERTEDSKSSFPDINEQKSKQYETINKDNNEYYKSRTITFDEDELMPMYDIDEHLNNK